MCAFFRTFAPKLSNTQHMTVKKKNAAIRAAGRVDLQTICHLVSEDTGISFATLNSASKHIFTTIRSILQGQQEVEIADFGRFSLIPRKERINSDIANPDGPKTYTPPTTIIRFFPDSRWRHWQRMHSAQLPDQLPEGTQLSYDYRRSGFIRRQTGDTTPMEDLLPDEASRAFYRDTIVARAKRRLQNADHLSQQANNSNQSLPITGEEAQRAGEGL